MAFLLFALSVVLIETVLELNAPSHELKNRHAPERKTAPDPSTESVISTGGMAALLNAVLASQHHGGEKASRPATQQPDRKIGMLP